MPFPLIPVIAAAGSVIGGAIQSGIGFRGQKKTNEKNLELAKYQYSKDLEMWNKGNAYNAPEAQMQRLKDAGLNPNMVYGQGAVANSSGQLPKYNAPTVDYNYQPPIAGTTANVLNQYQDFQIKQAQANNLREQGKVIAEEAKIKSFKNWLNTRTGEYQEGILRGKSEGLSLANTWAPQRWEQEVNKGKLSNRLFQDTYNEQVGIKSNQYKQGVQNLATGRINQRAKQQAIKMLQQKYSQSNEMFPYQLQYQKGSVNAQAQSIDNLYTTENVMKKNMEMKQLEIDTYMYQLYGNFAEKAMKQIWEMNKSFNGKTREKNPKFPKWK
ncbi:MAG: DNA pilot protein [Microviridae sp.]|nr:MAG: DNA pilot protein [Microviridae sp.]